MNIFEANAVICMLSCMQAGGAQVVRTKITIVDCHESYVAAWPACIFALYGVCSVSTIVTLLESTRSILMQHTL
jgi:hypothetical protein